MPVCPNCDIAYLPSETHECPKSTLASEKSLALAIGLNLVLPGAGYVYMGRLVLGVGALMLVVLTYLSTGLLLLPIVWLGMNAIMAIDMMILHKKNQVAFVAQTTKKCPYCAEVIQREAKICRFCRSDLAAHTR